MERIPVNFEQLGKIYSGYFKKVAGAGQEGVWYLMDDKNFYLGRLRQYQDQWVFDDSKPVNKLNELAEYFGEVITAWYG